MTPLLESPQANLRRSVREWLSPTSWRDVEPTGFAPCLCQMVALWHTQLEPPLKTARVVVRCPHGQDVYVHPDHQEELRSYLYKDDAASRVKRSPSDINSTE